MLRTRVAFLMVLNLSVLGAGCAGRSYYGPASILNPAHLAGEHGFRILHEAHQFHLDIDRVLFGIDYPGGAPESARQQYYGLARPGGQHALD